uniref:Uncharacterized protein n=1 Tax=Arundo donax TaxID=35708 RepID=A0A0A9DT17_ARUDO
MLLHGVICQHEPKAPFSSYTLIDKLYKMKNDTCFANRMSPNLIKECAIRNYVARKNNMSIAKHMKDNEILLVIPTTQ